MPPEVLTEPLDDRVEPDPEARVTSVRVGLAGLDERLARIEGDEMTPDERSMLVTLVLSLDGTIRDLEAFVAEPPSSNGNGNGRRGGLRLKRRPDGANGATPDAVPGPVDVQAEYRRDLAGRVAVLRRDLDERAGRILIVTGGGARKRRRFLVVPTALQETPATALTIPEHTLGSRLVATLRDRRALMLATGKVLTVLGTMCVLFLVFEFGLTGVLQNRDQRVLLQRFQTALPTTQLGRPDRPIPPASPVAIIDIPRIHEDEVVIEGTTTQLLKQGPGHFRATPLPGEFGNAVIAGHRTTYGAPFRNLNLLHPGDIITVTTGQGGFVYVVNQTYYVRPGQPDVFAGSADSRLTLITSDPPYAARGRMAVVALLQGAPVALDTRPPVPVGGNELGLSGDPVGAVLALVWAQLLFLAVWATRRLYRRWNPLVTYLLATPVILALVLLLFENLDRLLPGTL